MVYSRLKNIPIIDMYSYPAEDVYLYWSVFIERDDLYIGQYIARAKLGNSWFI